MMRRVIFLPGMAARSLMWEEAAKRLESETIQTDLWDWITPIQGESMSEYAVRWVTLNTSPHHRKRFVVGASFGGILGQEVAKCLDADALILVGSVRERGDLPFWIRSLSLIRGLVSWVPWRLVQTATSSTKPLWHAMLGKDLTLVADEFTKADPQLIAWSIRQILSWKGPNDLHCPITSVHGSRDRLLPLDLNQVDVVVHGAGHVVSVSHPDETSEAVRKVVQLFE